MTIAEYPPHSSPAPEPPMAASERTPPQDVAAEQSVLGAMLLSKDAIADVVEIIRQADFYRPAHQAIFGAVTDLFTKGEPADAITVAASLIESGDLTRIGGHSYLHTLVASVPTAANAGYYAEIVRDTAVRRRLVEAGTRIAQVAYAGEGDVDMMVDRAQAEVFDVTSMRTAEDYLPLAEIMDGAVAEIEGIASRGGEMVGVPTGFIDLDRLTNGLHAGQLIIVAARPASGKALALETAIPTPRRWSTMGDLSVGDQVLGHDGSPTTVVAATEVMTARPCYLVEFSDGSNMVADADHQWQVTLSGRFEPEVRTTTELRDWIGRWDGSAFPLMPPVEALRLPSAPLPIEPYAMGVWLASADLGEPITDAEILMWLDGRGLSLSRIDAVAHDLGISPQGFMPRTYLRGSLRQRRDLLAGILDVIGEVDSSGAIVLNTASRPMAQDLYELLATLGVSAAMSVGPVRGRRRQATVRVTFTCDEAVFHVHHKDVRHKELWGQYAIGPAQQRFMTTVTPIPSVPVRCIEVDNASHVYLAGRGMVPTHNSTLGLDIARSASIAHGLASVIFSLEMSRNEIVMRLLSAEAQVPLGNMRSGKMHDPEWRKIASRQGVLHEAPLFVDDSPNMTMTEIRAKCRRLKQRHDLRLVIVDYMQLMTSGKKVESRQQEVSEFSRSLKLLAKELNVPVIAISQLNRGPETRNDKKPMLSDLRESGCLTAASRVIRADTGVEVSLGELYASGAKEVPVWSLDDSLRYRPRTLTHVFPTGHREVFRIRTESGRSLEVTSNHPLLTHTGWRAAGELSPGDVMGTVRHVPPPITTVPVNEDELVVLAHLLGSGAIASDADIEYRSQSATNLSSVEAAVVRRFGIIPGRTDEYRSTTLHLSPPHGGGPDPVRAWRDQVLPATSGLAIPSAIFQAPKDQISFFLRHLWATEGTISNHPSGQGGAIHFVTSSRRLADDVCRLLLRFGLAARLTTILTADSSMFRVGIIDPADQKVFLRRIGGHGLQGRPAIELLTALESRPGSEPRQDPATADLWREVNEVLAQAELSDQEHQARASAIAVDEHIDHPEMDDDIIRLPESEAISLNRLARVLDSGEMDLVATNDILWDEIVDVEYIGTQDVFDATVLGTHNFIADGVAVHNSLEQDADMVVLIHREDAYDKDSARLGEADLIVAKHRNGPTDTITVAFQGHYSRFVDMARE